MIQCPQAMSARSRVVRFEKGGQKRGLSGLGGCLGGAAVAVLGAAALMALVAASVTASTPPPSAPSSYTPPVSHPTAPDVPSARVAVSAAAPITLPSPCWRIGVSADGLYRLSYETLAAAGVPTDVPPSAYHLLWRGQEVALQEVGTGDTTFDPGDALLFYGQKFHGSVQDEKYTDENVYWLYVDDTSPGLRMGSRSGGFRVYLPLVVLADGAQDCATAVSHTADEAWYTATFRSEENNVYWSRWSTSPGTSTTWFWEQVIADGSPVTRTYPITLTALSSVPCTATLVLEVAGLNYSSSISPDHHLRLAVNSTTVGEVTWDGDVGAVFTIPFTSTALVSGTNQVHIVVLTDLCFNQNIYVDRVEIAFRRALVAEEDLLAWTTPFSGTATLAARGFSTATVRLYDITHPLTPTCLANVTAFLSGTTYTLNAQDTAPAGTAYLAVAESSVAEILSPTTYHPPVDLISPSVGADEIVLAPMEFITAIQPLVDLRQSQGLRVRVVDVEDVYAMFNGGVLHPEAIRAFVAHAYDSWPGPPGTYLLLVGDGHFNFKHYNPDDYGDPARVWLPPYLEFADPDQGEVPVDSRFGDVDDDGMPEVMVGRIPAGSVAEVEGAIAKIVTYESSSAAAWMERVLHAADDGYGTAEDFSQILDDLAQDFLPSSFETRTVYIEDYCNAPTTEQSCPSATLALTQTWSQGVSLLSYAGHAAVWRWAHEPLVLNTQLSKLTGTVGLPFVISLDCWDGYWMFPPKYHSTGNRDVRSIGEWTTAVLTDRGAIGVFGPAGLAYPGPEEQLAQAMYQAMFQEGNFQLGPMTQAGREAVPSGFYHYLARTYTLFGDPALWLPWWDHMTITPTLLTMTVGTSITLSDNFVVTGTTRFTEDFPITPTWTASAGELDGWGHYTAPNYATVIYLTAHMGAVSATVTVNVVEGGLGMGPVSSGLLALSTGDSTGLLPAEIVPLAIAVLPYGRRRIHLG